MTSGLAERMPPALRGLTVIPTTRSTELGNGKEEVEDEETYGSVHHLRRRRGYCECLVGKLDHHEIIGGRVTRSIGSKRVREMLFGTRPVSETRSDLNLCSRFVRTNTQSSWGGPEIHPDPVRRGEARVMVTGGFPDHDVVSASNARAVSEMTGKPPSIPPFSS